jgi:hypothetical protein
MIFRNRARDIGLRCFLKADVSNYVASTTANVRKTQQISLPSRLDQSDGAASPAPLRPVSFQNNLMLPGHPNLIQLTPPPNGYFLPPSALRTHGSLRNPQGGHSTRCLSLHSSNPMRLTTSKPHPLPNSAQTCCSPLNDNPK